MKKFSQWSKYIKKAAELMVIISPFIGLVVFWNIPEQQIFHGQVVCIFERFLHIEFPECCMVRAFYSVVHFNFSTAFQYNRMVVIVFPSMSILILRWMYKKIKIFLKK